jgi:hypothetical protein
MTRRTCHTRRCVSAVCCVACVAGFAAQAAAQMTAVTRTSRVYAWEHIIDLGGNDLGITSGEASTTNLLTFDRTVTGGGYTARQTSSLNSSVATVNCNAFGNPHSMGFGGAESRFTFVFDVTSPATFTLEGTQSRFIGDAIVSLSGPGVNTTIYSNTGTWPGSTPFSYSGLMTGGRYTFEVIATADWGSVDATLIVIPAPWSAPLVALVACTRRRR